MRANPLASPMAAEVSTAHEAPANFRLVNKRFVGGSLVRGNFSGGVFHHAYMGAGGLRRNH
jgi:hypothetical protein